MTDISLLNFVVSDGWRSFPSALLIFLVALRAACSVRMGRVTQAHDAGDAVHSRL